MRDLSWDNAMNLPTLLVLAVVAVLLLLAVRSYVRGERRIGDCGCGRGSACEGCGASCQFRDYRESPSRKRKPTLKSNENGCSRS